MLVPMKQLAWVVFLVMQTSGSGAVNSSKGAAVVAPTLKTETISEAGAQQVIIAAKREAETLQAPCAIAVVDGSGILVAFTKMDGVRPGSPDLAIGKARTSALLQRPSGETEENVDNGRLAFVTSGLMTLRGGVPLRSGGLVVGAVGVASLNKENDVKIAEAAGAAFALIAPALAPALAH